MSLSVPSRALLFTRFPAPGKVKTRLIGGVTPEEAARLHRLMTEKALEELRGLGPEIEIEIRFTGADAEAMRRWLGGDLCYAPQGEGDLGERLERAFAEAFAAGAERVVAIGADAPALTGGILRQGFDSLAGRDLVLGPASDGGYYLVGMRRPLPAIFRAIAWGTGSVLEETLTAARREGVEPMLLATLDDVDRPEDLARARELLGE